MGRQNRGPGHMHKPRVLIIHNRYQQPGGEDAVVSAEADMLQRNGHEVVKYVRNNSEISTFRFSRKVSLFATTTWNRNSYRQLRDVIRKKRPDVAHCHNLVPLISPSAYYACHDSGIPVVQTLHNYRLLCPAATLFRNEQACTRCLGKPAVGISRGCYRGSRVQTATIAMMLAAHKLRGTWHRLVDAYVAVSRFSRDLHTLAGLPGESISVKPNFVVCDPGRREGYGDYALFVGRLSPEKGVLEMLLSWKHLPYIPLRVVGGGPLYEEALGLARSAGPQVSLFGQMSATKTLAQIKSARFLVFPSLWYEPFGMTLIEAAACGVPSLASRTGGIPEIVNHGSTGLLFNPREPQDLIAKAEWAWTHPDELHAMGGAARQMYLENYTADGNYECLMEVYDRVLKSNRDGATS